MVGVLVLKLLIFFLRSFTSNSATALPGLLLEKYFKRTLKKLLNQFDEVILITGTNGKTTTSRILCDLLDQNNTSYISNSSGSNLVRGIASVLINRSNAFGKLPSKLGIFEVEEATMPKLVKFVKPEVIIVTNIFRDQLDAYGEIDKTYRYIKESISSSDNPKLVLNKNDQRVESFSELTNNDVVYIAFDEMYLDLIKLENKETKGAEQVIRNDLESNIYQITNIRIGDDLETFFDIRVGKKDIIKEIKLLVPGYHNTFNALAALLGFSLLSKTDLKSLFEKKKINLEDFKPVFGRGEIITYKKTNFQILLVKNPAGMNLNLKLLESVKNRGNILFILNDNIADGRDVSWIWDSDFSILSSISYNNIYVTGSRRFDMGLRIKYQGLEVKEIFENIEEAIYKLSEEEIDKVFVLPTYTAMLEMRKQFRKITDIKKMWE